MYISTWRNLNHREEELSAKLFDFSTGYSWNKLTEKNIALFEEWRNSGRLGFFDLPVTDDLHKETLLKARKYTEKHDTLFVAGIGGSSLGLRAMLSAFSAEHGRVCLIDSPDSGLIKRAIDERGGGNPAICVITKSGGTAETLSIFMELRRLLGRNVPVMAVTDPEKGSLRKLALEKGWDTLPVPANVGGRFSVLSPVGMFPGAFAGIDTSAVIKGAQDVRNDFLENGTESLSAFVAGAFLSRFQSHPVHVFMPYTDRLYQTAMWFSQLWAESLGKALDLQGNQVHTGQTPLACRGPADQHSLVQLFMEGPLDKTVTIVREASIGTGKPLEGEFSGIPSMAYLQGRSPDELRVSEAEATAEALEERGVPVSKIVVPHVNGECLGQLFMALETATVLCGLAMNIDPLNQPGVERGKILTYRYMGREGY